MQKMYRFFSFIGLVVFSVLLCSGVAFAGDQYIDDKMEIENLVDEMYPNIPDTEKEMLSYKMYEERVNGPSLKLDFEEPEPYVKEEDPAYIAVMDEEKYIVSLIEDMGGNANLDSWESNLEFLLNNYNDIVKQKDTNMYYVDDYIESYEVVKLEKDDPKEKVYTGKTLISSKGYDYDAAVNYAYKYGANYNSSYPDWTLYGGDCANFASQCLYAGGKSMVGSKADSVKSWFSRGSQCNTKKVSGTWRGANMFKEYWKNRASKYKQFNRGGIDTYNYTWPGVIIHGLVMWFLC